MEHYQEGRGREKGVDFFLNQSIVERMNDNNFGDLTLAAAGELDDFNYDALMAELNADPDYVADVEARRAEALAYQMMQEAE